jgi:hypothetical protein
VRWPSTFNAYIAINPVNGDGTPNLASAEYAGGFYESNTVGAVFPKLNTDDNGNPTGLQVTVNGCGDGDPSTFEGYFDGFTPVSIFHAFGISDQLLQDSAVLQKLIEVRDLRTNTPVSATFDLVGPADMPLEPVPGVTLPSPPAGSAITGVRTTSAFSYSEHVLVQRGKPGAMRALRSCRAKGGRPSARNGQLVCVPDTTPPRARLISRRALKRGQPVVVSCNEPCTAVAKVEAGGSRLAGGRRKIAKAGRVRIPLSLTAAGRTRLASEASVSVALRVTVSDRAGNHVRLTRRLPLRR